MKETAKVHFGYVITILVIVNIVTVTARLGQSTELVAYISFAATLASLLLAILAIVYSYLSSGSVASFTEKISEAQVQLDAAAASVSSATARFEEIATSLPQAVKSLDEKVTRTHEMLANLSSAATEKKVGEISAPSSDVKVSLVRLAVGSSPHGLLCLLVACEAFRAKKSFQLSDLSFSGYFEDDYAYGWFMALDAADVVDSKVKGKSFTIVKIPDGLGKIVELAIKDRVESTMKKDDTKEIAAEFDSAAKHIREYFKDEEG